MQIGSINVFSILDDYDSNGTKTISEKIKLECDNDFDQFKLQTGAICPCFKSKSVPLVPTSDEGSINQEEIPCPLVNVLSLAQR